MRRFLTTEQAVQVIKGGEWVHTFRTPGSGMLLGADWKRTELVDLLSKLPPERVELAGEQARRLGHGLCVWESEDRPMFVETNTESLAGLRAEICEVDEA